MIEIKGLDHFVVTVSSIEEAAAFYQRVLGFEIDRTGAGRTALRSNLLRINLHEEGRAPDLRAPAARAGASDFCLEVAGPAAAVVAHLEDCGIEIEAGPVARAGARGEMTSVYFRDPDGNLVELSVYGDDAGDRQGLGVRAQ